MSFSIVIVSYNTRHLLASCLKSIFEVEESREFEVVVVDNNSIDSSPDLVEKRFPQVKLIRSRTNVGFAAANNLGIAESKCEYLVFLNPDTEVLEPGLLPLITFLKEKPSAGMVGAKLLNPDRILQPSCRSFPSLFNIFSESLGLHRIFPRSKLFGRYYMTFFNHESARQVDWMKGACFAVPRRVIEEVGAFDEKFFLYSEEMDLARRMGNSGYEVWFLPKVRVIHYGGKSAEQRGKESYLENLKSQFSYLEKHLTRQARTGKALIILGAFLRFLLWSLARLGPGKEKRKEARKRKGLYSAGVKWGWGQLRRNKQEIASLRSQ